MKKLFTIFMLGIILFSCGKKEAPAENESSKGEKKASVVKKKEKLTASTPPLKWLVEKIAGDEFEVISIIQPNMNHELFDPKPEDLRTLENSKLFFTYNALSFEEKITDTITDKRKIIDLLKNANKDLLLEEHDHDEDNHGHDHGDFDPHVWFSLELMPMFAENIKNRLIETYPHKKETFEKNYSIFLEELNAFKQEINGKMSSKSKKYFMSYHPTLGYFLKNYNIKEISVEYQGKEPSAKKIKEIIEEAKEHSITTILVQPQFPKQSIEVISKEIPNSKIVEFNPDEENVFENLKKFVNNLE